VPAAPQIRLAAASPPRAAARSRLRPAPLVPVLPSPFLVVWRCPAGPVRAPPTANDLELPRSCPVPDRTSPCPCLRPTRPLERSTTTPLRAVRARTVCRGACRAQFGRAPGRRRAAAACMQTGSPDGAAPRALRATARDGSTHIPPSLPLPSMLHSGRAPTAEYERPASRCPAGGTSAAVTAAPSHGPPRQEDCNRRGGARRRPAGMGGATGGWRARRARLAPHAGDRFEREPASAIAAAALWRHHRLRGHAAAGRPAERGGRLHKTPGAPNTPHPAGSAPSRAGAGRCPPPARFSLGAADPPPPPLEPPPPRASPAVVTPARSRHLPLARAFGSGAAAALHKHPPAVPSCGVRSTVVAT